MNNQTSLDFRLLIFKYLDKDSEDSQAIWMRCGVAQTTVLFIVVDKVQFSSVTVTHKGC